MDIRKMLKENILIEVYDLNSRLYYKSIIQEIGEKSIAIGIPMKDQKKLLMPKGSEWEFKVVVDDALYFFTGRIVGQKISDRVPLYLISWPERVRRQQRRNYYRLPCMQEIYFWILSRAGNGGTSVKKQFDAAVREDIKLEQLVEILGEPNKTVTSDLSGGGLSFAFPSFIPEGSVLGLNIFLKSKKEGKNILIKGMVVWIKKMEELGKRPRYKYGVEFIDCGEQLREEIVRFVFLLSREKLTRR